MRSSRERRIAARAKVVGEATGGNRGEGIERWDQSWGIWRGSGRGREWSLGGIE